MGRRRNGVSDFFSGFAQAYGAGTKIAHDIEDARVRNDVRQVESDFTPRETEAVSGQDALAAGRQARDAALANATTDEQRAQIEQQFAPTLRALESDVNRPASIIKSIGVGSAFQQRDGADFSRQEIESGKAQERARIYSAAGRGDDAARTLLNSERSRAIADQDEIRQALNPAGLRPGENTRNQAMRSSIGTGADITGASSTPEHAPSPNASGSVAIPGTTPYSPAAESNPGGTEPGLAPAQIAQGGVSTALPAPRQQPATSDLDAYLKNVAPKALQTLVKQGRLDEAKRFGDFMDSEQGRTYAQAWMRGVRAHAIGDNQGALSAFEDLYNKQMLNDGRTVKMTPLDDGKSYRIDQLEADGRIVASKSAPIAELANQAALALEPTQAVAFHARQEAAVRKEGALLDRQIDLENLRQSGRQDQEDRRDDRLGMRLDAQDRNLERRLEAIGRRGGLTAAQERSNAEIDAARERVSGLDPAEIRRRTLKQTDTGRENPDFDASLAKAASMAGRRKIGEDDAFDSRQNLPKAPAFNVEDARKRFRGDRAMDGYTLGNVTPQGVEVLQKGRVVGHYQ